jgi:signal transduction histidine kinase
VTDALVKVSRALRSEQDVTRVLRRTLRTLATAMAADAAIAWDRDHGDGQLKALISYRRARAGSRAAFALSAAPLSAADTARPLYRIDQIARVSRVCSGLHAMPHRSVCLQPIEIDGQLLGVLGFFWKDADRRPMLDERRVIIAAARQLALALETIDLTRQVRELKETLEERACEGERALQCAYDELRTTREELRTLSSHVDRVRERERTRIAREIHDELGQALTGLKIDLVRLSQTPTEEAALEVAQLPAAIDDMISSVRRIASELRPHLLDDLGLVAALEWQAQDFVRRTSVKCRFRCRGIPECLDEERSMALFRIFQEVLTNIARHAQATQVQIALVIGDTAATLEVSDNGRGISNAPAGEEAHFGLLGMQERAAACGGRVVISGAAPHGTTVRVRIPFRTARATKGQA